MYRISLRIGDTLLAISISEISLSISDYSLKFQSYLIDFHVEKVTEVSVTRTENSSSVFLLNM